MISASVAHDNARNKVNSIKNSPEFKYAMNKIEQEIISESKNGKCEIKHGLCAFCKDGGFPSEALREAIEEELIANGYSYHEYQQMNIRGDYNSCFCVSW